MSSGEVKKVSREMKNVNSSRDLVNLPLVESSPMTTPEETPGPIQPKPVLWLGLKPLELVAMLIISTLVLAASYRGWWAISVEEAWGFATGGICVWLVVREHLWNWPVGLANNIVFFILFLRGRLYADMGLQIIYLGLGIYGWVNWIFGGKNHTALMISRTTRIEWIALAATIPICTLGMREILIRVNDAAPLWDALTTVLSLAAQYLLCRKRFENWWFWIAADVIYIPLYFTRKLPLTAVLYVVFLAMCLIGVREWSRSLKKGVPVE